VRRAARRIPVLVDPVLEPVLEPEGAEPA
jgi:hypothetical protein